MDKTEQIKNLVGELPLNDVAELVGWLIDHYEQRKAEAMIGPRLSYEQIVKLQDAGKLPKPDALTTPPRHVEDAPEWEHPQKEVQNFYHPGDIIQHDGKLWKSVYEYLNGDVPGESSLWQEIQPAPDPEAES